MIEEMFRTGYTQGDLARRFKISRQRVQQVLKSRGLDKSTGGRSAQKWKRRKEAAEIALNKLHRKERKVIDLFGCSAQEAMELGWLGWSKTDRGSPAWKYVQQKRNARYRKIDWGFTLLTWWKLWGSDGHWLKRGTRKSQYVMARFGDSGPYAPENVYLATTTDNRHESYRLRRMNGKWKYSDD